MRTLALVFLALALVAIDARQIAQHKRAVSCETVLSSKLCGTLKVIAKTLKLQSAVIDKAISEAVAKGKVSAEDIYNDVVDFLKNEVADKKCEAFLAPKMCARIKKIATDLSLDDVIETLIKEAIIMGIPSEEKIFLYVINLIRREIAGKTCVDFLAPKMCTRLVQIGSFVKINSLRVAEFVKEAIIAGYTQKDDIYNAVIKFFKEDIAGLTCEDILNAKICTAFDKLAGLTQLTRADIDNAVKDAVMKGKIAVHDIIDDVKDYFRKIASSKKCEDILPSVACSTLKTLAAQLKVKADMVDEAVREAVRDGVVEISKIIKYCEEYVRKHVTCEAWLGETTCKYVRKFASMAGVKVQEVEDQLRKLVSEGKTAAADLYKAIIAYIKKNLWG